MFLYWEDKTTKLFFSLKNSTFSLIKSKNFEASSSLFMSFITSNFVLLLYTSTAILYFFNDIFFGALISKYRQSSVPEKKPSPSEPPMPDGL